MRDATGKEVQLGDRIAVSVGRRGYLRFGKVVAIKERQYKKYNWRAGSSNEPELRTSAIVTYEEDKPENKWVSRSYVKRSGKFVVLG